ncbi:MAG: hypothetical protein AAB966_04420 [Patescibacteria group bacterium]
MKKILSIIFLIVIGLGFYIATLKGISGNPHPRDFKNNLDQATKPFELSPERGRYLLTYSLAENNSFSLNKESADAAYPDVGYIDGKYYIYFAPGVSIVALPGYLLGKSFGLAQVFSYFMVSLFAILNLIFIYLISKNVFKISNGFALLSAITFGFATTSWSYAVTLYQHHISLFFILSSYYAAWKYSFSKRWYQAFYIWLSFGLSLFLDYPNAILMLPVLIYFFLSTFSIKSFARNVKISFSLNALLTSVIFFALIFLHGYYNYVNFGSPTKLSGELTGYKSIVEAQEKQRLTENQKTQGPILENKSALTFFSEEQLVNGATILSFSRDRGLFLFSPVLLIGLIYMLYFYVKKRAREVAVLIALIIVNLFLYSSWGDPWGGWAYGPRYMLITMSILSIFVAVFLAQKKNLLNNILSKTLFLVLFGVSSAIALLGVLTTNAVPPKVEADYLKMNYNYLHNFIFYERGQSSSFIFNEYLSPLISLKNYSYLIWGLLIFIALILLFVMPLFEKNHES